LTTLRPIFLNVSFRNFSIALLMGMAPNVGAEPRRPPE
jgi:hypothetical protein